ncbi:hypothetical protein E2C01_094821 [Portunus trituberculatus]|uniref:Uncharacterized protein n=1 Tax=Portunus trituberculatus TaxID=210409 RepID=A0A5B7K2P6_PORTR|nr:hypothetical protein [Portunus trituberculatus]
MKIVIKKNNKQKMFLFTFHSSCILSDDVPPEAKGQ